MMTTKRKTTLTGIVGLNVAVSLALATGLAASPAALADDHGEPKLAAVLVYADWCSSCQVLDPKVEAVKAGDAIDGVTFVKLDYTAREDEAFYEQADTAHVDEALEAFMGEQIKTGQLLLVDLDDERVIGKVTKTLTEAEITGALKAAAAVS